MAEAPHTLKFERLRKRPDFLLAAKAPALSRGAVFIQMRQRTDDDPTVRVGFTATKKIGGAVERNRAKRRLREAARLVLPLHARPSHDYVFIARGGTGTREWARLLDDVKTALISLAADLDRGGTKVSRRSNGALHDAAPSSQPDPTVSG
ncbi:ribonuclease P protein component [Caulobacter vibrioides]|uniref:Ribonuclease P protein component n=2 Tax=Caulobacter vibrioides TaxID=155892 RepID=RNPA_CAUVC|nr:ribonuclease P protein component [Caulobacter vibrioides]YP_002516180.1 ribonuclease P protein component [Caulobacter vibrioides NA1000]B8H1E9.1 RecName: Full=Ribonuclease P protein component; Short=RNase P protein; Short=RNaseP protein; AltName: Full=Protein C5 [Caulobacter vibrioides NA1000]Q9AA39.1 RecName: Full=Ribonuclease P protein component; Short=RNase P protein; Short=RNaseP protein; AltName: Full=Protein C5 [Caulobacter vibrioides CB15]QBQ56949.1 ribonuclease P protein component [s